MYRATAKVIDLMMIYVNQILRNCEEMITACNHHFGVLKDNLRRFTPKEACDASAQAFKAIWRSNLPDDTKQFYTNTLNTMHKCMVTQTYSHEYVSCEGDVRVHDDFDVNSVSAVLTHLRDDVVVIRNQLEGFRTRTKNVYLNGGRYKDIYEALGACFETVADLKPTYVWVDIIEAYIKDARFKIVLDNLMYQAVQLSRLVTNICEVSVARYQYMCIPIYVKTDHPERFKISEFISKGDYMDGDIVYPAVVGILKHVQYEEVCFDDGYTDEFDSHKRIHYTDCDSSDVGDYDPMERMYQFNDDGYEYTPTDEIELIDTDIMPSINVDECSMFNIYDVVPNWNITSDDDEEDSDDYCECEDIGEPGCGWYGSDDDGNIYNTPDHGSD